MNLKRQNYSLVRYSILFAKIDQLLYFRIWLTIFFQLATYKTKWQESQKDLQAQLKAAKKVLYLSSF